MKYFTAFILALLLGTSVWLWRDRIALQRELALHRSSLRELEEKHAALSRPSKSLPDPAVVPTFGTREPKVGDVVRNETPLPGGGVMRWKAISGNDARVEADARNVSSLRDTYGPILDRLGFNEAERARFYEIQMQSKASSRELFRRAVEAAPDRESATIKSVANAVAQDTKQHLQATLLAEFGAQVVDAINAYEYELPAKSMVDTLNKTLLKDGAALTQEQRVVIQALIKANYHDDDGNYNLRANVDVILRDASPHLTDKQLEALRSAITLGSPQG